MTDSQPENPTEAAFAAAKDPDAPIIACLNDPTKDCVSCGEFDECAYVDRHSSLASVAFGLVFSMAIIGVAFLWIMLR